MTRSASFLRVLQTMAIRLDSHRSWTHFEALDHRQSSFTRVPQKRQSVQRKQLSRKENKEFRLLSFHELVAHSSQKIKSAHLLARCLSMWFRKSDTKEKEAKLQAHFSIG